MLLSHCYCYRLFIIIIIIIIIIVNIFCNCLIDAQVGQAELYIRLVNSRDVTSQDALNAQPIQHYMYKYPALVSGHSRCKGQAKLVKRYAKNSPAQKLLVVCLTCRQAHLKEKTQLFCLFVEGRVVGGRSSNTICYNAPWAIWDTHILVAHATCTSPIMHLICPSNFA